jgi:hypothetical protein
LQNFGWLFSFRFSFALVVFSRPISSSKTSLYFSRISCHRVDGFPGGVVANVLIAFQSSVIFPSQSRPKRAGPQGRRKHQHWWIITSQASYWRIITSQITYLCSAEICKHKQRLRMLYDIKNFIHILLIINFENFNET